MKTTLKTYYYKTMLHILPYVTIWFNPTEKGLTGYFVELARQNDLLNQSLFLPPKEIWVVDNGG